MALKNASPSLYNEDLAPAKERNWGAFSIFNVWTSDVHSLWGYYLAASLFLICGNFVNFVIAIGLGSVVIYFLMNLVGQAGVRIGVPYPVLARASFGIWGATIPALVRAIVACFWYGAQTSAASGAIVALLTRSEGMMAFQQSSHMLGHSTLEVICYFVVWALQLLIIQRGMETVRKFQDWAGPAVWVMMLILALYLTVQAGGISFGSDIPQDVLLDKTKDAGNFGAPGSVAALFAVAATWIKNAVQNGTKLLILDPRRSDLTRMAHRHLQFKPDTDVPLLNAMMNVIVTEGLVNEEFIASRTIGYEELRKNVEGYTPELMAPICGIDAETIRYVARLYATSNSSMILWGMGISQHVHGTDNARCLIALALMTGQIGRPGTGLHPLRGQNNVQGASDAGLIPMMFPDYQHVTSPAVRASFEKAWKVPEGSLDAQPGLTVVEVMHAIKKGGIRGMYVQGENPAMSDPDANHARESLAALDHLVVQDIFLTETAYLADVILPASAFPEKDGSFTNTDRLVQMGRKAINPPGDARQDLWIIQQIAKRMGCDWHYKHVSEVFDEMRHTMPSIGGITWERLEREHSVTYPCIKEGDPGQSVVFVDSFPSETGRARFVPADIIPANERPDTEYPLVLITGRQLEHWHTGSMTRRATVLDAIEPDPVALVHPLDLAEMGGKPGDIVTIESRRGQVALYARADESSPRGAVFVPFCYYEAAINKLTNAALDPFAKIPEFKYCAIRVSLGGIPPVQNSYGGGKALENSIELARA